MSGSYSGFWSYVHKDDEAEGKRISRLARDVVAQYEMITGDTIELFLDKDGGIEWGDEWRGKIEEQLASVAFFIPVMTPRYFKSEECRKELRFFVQRANKFGFKEMLLPLYYVDIPSFDEGAAEEDDLLRRVREFQLQDWRDLRFKEVNSEAYRRGVSDMARRLVQANKHAEEANVDEAAPEMEGETGGEGENTLGTIDRLAMYEEALPKLSDTTTEIAKQINIIGEVMREGKLEIVKVGTGRGAFGRRIQVARRVTMKLTGPTDKISMLTNQYASQLHDVDEGIRIIIKQAAPEIEENPDVKTEFCHFFESVETLLEASHSGRSGIQKMVDAVAPIEKTSRDLRPVIRRLRQALTIMLESSEVCDHWKDSIKSSGVDCRGFGSGVE